MSRAWIFLLGIMGIVTTNCVGFSINRSDTEIVIPADRRGSIQMLFDGKIHAADRDNVLRGTNAEKLNKEEEKCFSCSDDPPRVRRSDNILHQENQLAVNHKNASELKESTILSSGSSEARISDVTEERSLASEAPRNVVLLLVENAGSDRVTDAWSSFGAGREFSVQGSLQNCPSTDLSEGSKFLLGESLGKNECECQRYLRANVGSLLSWARHTKDMATVSASNFSIPSPLGYERLSSQVVKEVEDKDYVNGIKQNARQSRSSLRANRRLIELQRQSTTLSSSMPTLNQESATKPDGLNGYDGMWDVFDMFSRIRMAFFRILLESLGNLSAPEDEFSGTRPFPVQPSVVDLVSDTLRDLKSVPSDQGFIMVVAAPGNELSAVVQVLQSEVSAEDTLLVVLGMCSENNEPVPLFANGPGGKALLDDRTVSDVPGSIRRIISNGCHGKICKNKSQAEPLALPSLEQLSFTHDLPRKRVVRAKEEDETTSSTVDDKTTKDSVDVDNTSDEKTIVSERKEGSGAQISRIDKVTAILGTVTSITAMLALSS